MGPGVARQRSFPSYSTLRRCMGRGAFEAIPGRPTPVDLSEARRRLEAEGTRVTDARVLLIVAGEPELTMTRTGRILIKTPDLGAAEAALDRLLRTLAWPARPAPAA